MVKTFYNIAKDSWFLFQEKRGTTLSSSSTFYILLTTVPFFLLIIRVIGLLLGDLESTQVKFFDLASKFLPDVAPEILLRIQNIVKGPLFAKGQFTILNFLILMASSLSFFNSIWNGLFLITEDKNYLNHSKHLKGLLVIGVTIVMLTILFFLPTLVFYIGKMMSHNTFVSYIELNFPNLYSKLFFITGGGFDLGFILSSNLFHFIIFASFFTFLYRWFFSWKLSFKQAFVGSFTFSCLIIAGKNLFWIYFMYVRETLLRNYGDYYTVIVAIIWLYLTMSFFYYGACVCTTLMKKKMLKT